MSLRLKILGCFMFIVAIFTIATGIVYYNIGTLQVAVSDIPHEVERVNQLNVIEHNIVSQTAAMRGFLNYKQDNFVEEFKELGEENISIIQTMINTARNNTNEKYYKNLLNHQEQYNNVLVEKLIPLVQEDKVKEANEVALYEGVPLTNTLNDAITPLVEKRSKNLLEIVKNTNSQFISLRQLSLLSSISALIIGLLLGFFLARSITRPIQKIAGESLKIAKGDLTGKEIDIKTKDEIGQLATAFNKMLRDLKELVTQLQEKSQVVASSSMQLSANSQNVAAGAQETASTISQVAGTVEQITENTQHIATTSEQAAAYAREGNDAISRINLQMEAIKNTTTGSSEAINSLNRSAAQISQIVELITQIADQTNLLALNAAIEAARAREHGRGFAVVAEEVRKLAEQSASAAKEINKLISTIQQKTGMAVQSMTDSFAQVKEGATVVAEVGTTFEKIISAVHNLSEEIQSVAAAAEQMSSSVQNVAAAAEEQTSSIEEVSSTSQNLAGMAEELDGLSKQFKVE